jgi:flagellar biosynthesis chaperone FliJ
LQRIPYNVFVTRIHKSRNDRALALQEQLAAAEKQIADLQQQISAQRDHESTVQTTSSELQRQIEELNATIASKDVEIAGARQRAEHEKETWAEDRRKLEGRIADLMKSVEASQAAAALNQQYESMYNRFFLRV